MTIPAQQTPSAAEQNPRHESSRTRCLSDHESDFYQAFRREHPTAWLLTFIGPPIVSVVLLVLIYFIAGGPFLKKLLIAAAATFFVFGKFVILGGGDPSITEVSGFLTRGELFLLVVYMDLMTAILLVFHAGFLFRIPLLGPKLLDLAEDGQFLLQLHPWMRRATFLGIIAFVMFPLAATGAIGGAIFGRLLGMPRVANFVGIGMGSVLGCAIMYFGAGLINQYLDRDNPLHTIGGIAVVGLVMVLLNYRYRQMKRGALGESKNGD